MQYLYKHRNILISIILIAINTLLFIIFTQNQIDLVVEADPKTIILMVILYLVQVALAVISLVIMWNFINDILPLKNEN